MRKSLFTAVAVALLTIGTDVESFFHSSLSIQPNIASASVTLAIPLATTTLAGLIAEQPASSNAVETPAQNLSSTASAPTVAVAASAAKMSKTDSRPPSEDPARITVASIGLDTTIIPVGINKKGEMDVPSGSTMNVGWYSAGPKPGQVGSAVLDAHVFAAFKNLKNVKVGDEIVVETAQGSKLRFVVEDARVYKLSELTSNMLFGSKGGRDLHLITCAGNPVGNTYSHRLVVYAKYVGIA